jgi:actin-related protein
MHRYYLFSHWLIVLKMKCFHHNCYFAVGGVTMMPGFKSRLAQELKSLLSQPKYASFKISKFKLHQPPAKPNITTWLGE